MSIILDYLKKPTLSKQNTCNGHKKTPKTYHNDIYSDPCHIF